VIQWDFHGIRTTKMTRYYYEKGMRWALVCLGEFCGVVEGVMGIFHRSSLGKLGLHGFVKGLYWYYGVE
jgi:hypothetical protein